MRDLSAIFPIILIIALGCVGLFISLQNPDTQAINPQEPPMSNAIYEYSTWGILIQDLSTGETLYDLNSKELFVPGSTTKLFSSAAALDAYGANYTFKTPVYAQGSVDKNGTLKGNLVLVASGDLTMGGRNTNDSHIAFTNLDHGDANSISGVTLTQIDPLSGIEDLAKQVKASGINKVDGNVIIDTSLFNTTPIASGDYSITPIMINDNLIDFEITPGKAGEDAVVKWRPQSSVYRVISNVKTVSSGEENIEVDSKGNGTIIVKGQIPANSSTVIRTYAIEDPASFARSLFIEALIKEGVDVTAPINGTNPQELLQNNSSYGKEVASLTSLPFAENIKVILKVSQNEQADTLIGLLAAKNGNKTFDEGMAVEGAFLDKIGIASNSIFLSDGRGGESADRISPQASNQLLRYIAQQSYFESYLNALPIMGVDGSLAGVVSNDSSVYGNVKAKTGTTINVDKAHGKEVLLTKSLAGYMTTKSGRKLVFSIYVNNVVMNDPAQAGLDVNKDFAKILEKVYETY